MTRGQERRQVDRPLVEEPLRIDGLDARQDPSGEEVQQATNIARMAEGLLERTGEVRHAVRARQVRRRFAARFPSEAGGDAGAPGFCRARPSIVATTEQRDSLHRPTRSTCPPRRMRAGCPRSQDSSNRPHEPGRTPMTELPNNGLALHSTIRKGDSGGGTVELALVATPVPDPGPEEVVIRVEAAPINPSDLGVLFGPADVTTVRGAEGEHGPAILADIPDGLARLVAGRLGQTIPTGNEGAAPSSRRVPRPCAGPDGACRGHPRGSMYAEVSPGRNERLLVLPEGTTPGGRASCFVNPLTRCGMSKRCGSRPHGLVHTAPPPRNSGDACRRSAPSTGGTTAGPVPTQPPAWSTRAPSLGDPTSTETG